MGTSLVFWLPWSPGDPPAKQVVLTLLVPSAGDHLSLLFQLRKDTVVFALSWPHSGLGIYIAWIYEYSD